MLGKRVSPFPFPAVLHEDVIKMLSLRKEESRIVPLREQNDVIWPDGVKSLLNHIRRFSASLSDVTKDDLRDMFKWVGGALALSDHWRLGNRDLTIEEFEVVWKVFADLYEVLDPNRQDGPKQHESMVAQTVAMKLRSLDRYFEEQEENERYF